MIRLASSLCAFTSLCALLAASPIAPERGSKQAAAEPMRAAAPAAPAAKAADARGLEPRVKMKKPRSSDIKLPTRVRSGEAAWTGRLIVKFNDEVKGRARIEPSGKARDARGADVTAFNEVLANFRGTVRSLTRRSPADLRKLEERAERKSGKAQPDLAGMVYVDVRPDDLVAAARAFNDLDIVEWVSIESTPEQHQEAVGVSPQSGCGVAQAQWIPPEDSGVIPASWGAGVSNCYTAAPNANPTRCSELGGGPGCNSVIACVTKPVGPDCRFGCNDTACCNLVSTCLPACSDETSNKGWDAVCATYANILCASSGSLYVPGPPTPGFTGPFDPELVATDVELGSLPAVYRYDPCLAMRGPIQMVANPGPATDPATGPEANQVRVQGQLVDVLPPAVLADYPLEGFGLVTYGVDPNNGLVNFTSFQALSYPNGSVTDEADPTTNIPQQALPDPSLEGAGGLLTAGCFIEHVLPGCNQTPCCVFVCRVDPTCCLVEWDDTCVSTAKAAPAGDDPGELPPCFNGILDPASFPVGIGDRSPLFSGGRTPNGKARGYQVYVIGSPVSEPFEQIVDAAAENCALQPPQNFTYPVPAPVDNDPTDRCNINGNGGTRAFLNSNYRGGGLDMQYYAYAMYLFGVAVGPGGTEIPDPLLDPTFDPYDPSEAPLNGFGQGVRVAVIDVSAYLYNLPDGSVGGHEDLVEVATPEPNQTPILVDINPIDPNHGTAVLGVIGAQQNNFGITGIAAGLDELRFYPAVSFEEGERLASALTNALIDLDEGDIICLPIGNPENGNTILTRPDVYELVNTGTQAGVVVVTSAGNLGVGAAWAPTAEQPQTGAIVVGAAWPGYRVGTSPNYDAVTPGLTGLDFCRFQASNFASTLPDGSLSVHISGWGAGVTTLGYGDLFNGENPASDPVLDQSNPPFPPGGGQLTRNRLRSYTSGEAFEGTSPACAMIAGWCACLQSFARLFYGAPIAVRDLRDALQQPNNRFQQCGYPYVDQLGQPISIYPASSTACPQLGDVLTVGEGGLQTRIGGFPRTPETVAWIAAFAFSGANPVEFDVIAGLYQGGSAFSIRETDGASLIVESVRKRAGNVGQGVGNPLYYPMNGGTTDVQIIASRSQPIETITGFALRSLSRTSWSLPTVQIVYFYNFPLQRWQAMGYTTITSQFPGAPATYFSANAGPTEDFLVSTSNGGAQAWARVYTCGFGNVAYTVFHDLLDLTLCVEGGSQVPCEPPPPDPGL